MVEERVDKSLNQNSFNILMTWVSMQLKKWMALLSDNLYVGTFQYSASSVRDINFYILCVDHRCMWKKENV